MTVPRWRGPGPRLAFALSAGGYAFTAVILFWGVTSGHFPIPGGDAYVWDRAGDEVRAGASPYYLTPSAILAGTFFYAPPWAVTFAAISWLPLPIVAWGIIALEFGGLYYIAGSWLRVGYCLWFPVVAFELASGQFNLVIAATIAAALRGDPRWAPLAALQKLSPILAVSRRQWRTATIVLALAVLVTVPWLGLWIDWVRLLIDGSGYSVGPQIPIPLLVRLGLAVAAFVGLRGRPVARGLAAIIATPALYWVSLVLVLALIPARRSATSLVGIAVGQPATVRG